MQFVEDRAVPVVRAPMKTQLVAALLGTLLGVLGCRTAPPESELEPTDVLGMTAIPIRFARAEDIAEVLNELLHTPQGSDHGNNTDYCAMYRRGPRPSSLTLATYEVAGNPYHSSIVRAVPTNLAEAREWIAGMEQLTVWPELRSARRSMIRLRHGP